MSLEDLLNEGHLKPHRSSQREIGQLLAVFRRDNADARITGLSLDRQFESAYNAVLILSKAALAASGYRTSGEGNHYWTIKSLLFTLGMNDNFINTLNKFRHIRNVSNYEMTGMVSKKEVKEMISLGEELYTRLIKWLEENQSDLLTT
jgi:uncharacterized protein (UPF0332 family)